MRAVPVPVSLPAATPRWTAAPWSGAPLTMLNNIVESMIVLDAVVADLAR